RRRDADRGPRRRALGSEPLRRRPGDGPHSSARAAARERRGPGGPRRCGRNPRPLTRAPRPAGGGRGPQRRARAASRDRLRATRAASRPPPRPPLHAGCAAGAARAGARRLAPAAARRRRRLFPDGARGADSRGARRAGGGRAARRPDAPPPRRGGGRAPGRGRHRAARLALVLDAGELRALMPASPLLTDVVATADTSGPWRAVELSLQADLGTAGSVRGHVRADLGTQPVVYAASAEFAGLDPGAAVAGLVRAQANGRARAR